MLLYAVTIFLSAFLLFQVQPMIAKAILPWFGGSSGVWTTCMLFFQVVLVLGYAYSHWTIRALRPRTQTVVHAVLLTASMIMLPIVPNPLWKPAGNEDPTLRILGLLAATIGLPYFLLSTTGPLLQAWFARDASTKGMTPYRLYALSNLGSMLALLSYPVAVEPFLPVRLQAQGWSAVYGAFLLLCGLTAFRNVSSQKRGEYTDQDAASQPVLLNYITWTALAAVASAMLLSVTNHLCVNVAAIPFLWVLPLSLYLLTFILCFDADGWYLRNLFLKLFAVALASMAYASNADSENMPLLLALPLFSVGLLICCMVCHGELARLKPHPRYLTSYFLMIAIGGALGGVFAGIVAPHSFPSYYELPVSIVAAAMLILVVLRRDPEGPFTQEGGKPLLIILATGVLVLTGYVFYEIDTSLDGSRVAVRNFYGGLKVHDTGAGPDAVRILTHGTINHGEQYLAPDRRTQPTTYYAPQAGAGMAITQHDRRSGLRVGVIGLGTGTLAAYGQAGDVYRFYEINPLVIQLATSEFSFTRQSQAKVDYVLGDARLSMEREPPQNYDVLCVDAFSSDAIPVHLLTEEAFRVYFHHLKPDGVLAVHVSNKYLDLRPVVALAARRLGKEARIVDTDDDEHDNAIFGATWVLLSADHGFFEKRVVKDASIPLLTPDRGRMWTDDFSNLYRILK